MVSSVLGLPAFRAEAPDDVDRFLDVLSARLDLSPEVRKELKAAAKAAQEDQVPFEIPQHLLAPPLNDLPAGAVWASFVERLGPVIVTPLTCLDPYAKLLEHLDEEDLLAGDYEVWASLDTNGKQALQPTLPAPEAPRSAAIRVEAEVKGAFPLAFNVVFQKAFVRVASEMWNRRQALAANWGSDQDSFLTAWCLRFNQRIGRGLQAGNEDWWIGAGRGVDGKIDFTQRGANAIAGFVSTLLMAPVESFAAIPESGRPIAKQAADWLVDLRVADDQEGRKGDR